MAMLSLSKVMRMKLLRIKDNSQLKKDAFSEVSKVTRRIADKTLQQLEREGVFVFPETIEDAEDVEGDQMILQSINDCFRSGNVIGFLGCGDERLIIQSRFSSDDNDYFFQYLLDKVLEFPNLVDLNVDADQNNRLFNFLLFLFPRYLKAAVRKGLFKEYIRNRYNDENVKGSIDVARHIQKNTPFTGSVAYSQREFSYDNHLIQLVRHTIEFIKKKPYGGNLLIKVKDEVKLVIEATQSYEPYDRQRIVETNKKNPVRHAYFREYLALQRLCLLILQHQKHQIGSGVRQIYGILFDGAWLWEEYVASLIDEAFYHPMNKGGKGAQRLGGSVFQSRRFSQADPLFLGLFSRNRMTIGIHDRAGHGDDIFEQAFGLGTGHQDLRALSTGGFSGNRHIIGVAAKIPDILLYPFKRRNLIHHAVID